ncbi:hypothetical protein ACFOGI_10055 [Virgibacillus xinjiangensis]|uniref:Uncharacterized protein n=1 Tax=Virgibacillus xinjiangensis TaxID=393090 RepID=A0ABV7CWC3_9BACI
MNILVSNCNHWIGWHVVEDLLYQNCHVHAMIDKGVREDLLLFFGRNSNLTVLDDETALSANYEAMIAINEVPGFQVNHYDRCLYIGHKAVNNSENITTIHPPLLFGEWMPMNEDGIYAEKEFIRFDSKKFSQEAMYIKDFTRALIQWVRAGILPSIIDAKGPADKMDMKRKDSVLIMGGGRVQQRVEALQEHYRTYRPLY